MGATASSRPAYLAERGHAVRVSFVGEQERLKGDARSPPSTGAGRSNRPRRRTDRLRYRHRRSVRRRPRSRVEGLPRAMIRAMNASEVPVIAVDLPSGVNGTTGAVMGWRSTPPIP